MKAMVLERPDRIENNPLKLKQVLKPIPFEREIRVKITSCGICRTDLHIIEGELVPHKLPIIPGHQIVGYVELLGKSVTKFRVGDYVGIPWLYKTCGVCRYCKEGRENLCDNALFTGYDVDGGYAEYVVVNENFLYHLPQTYKDIEIAPLLCGGTIGYYAFKSVDSEVNNKIGFFGFGSSAHITLQIARHIGKEVYVVARKERDFELAYELGATWAGKLEALNSQLDSAIVFAPAGEMIVSALEHIRKGGKVVSAGIFATPLPSFDYFHIYPEKTLTSIANVTRDIVKEFLEIANSMKIKTQVTEYELSQANLALSNIKHSKVSGSSVIKI